MAPAAGLPARVGAPRTVAAAPRPRTARSAVGFRAPSPTRSAVGSGVVVAAVQGERPEAEASRTVAFAGALAVAAGAAGAAGAAVRRGRRGRKGKRGVAKVATTAVALREPMTLTATKAAVDVAGLFREMHKRNRTLAASLLEDLPGVVLALMRTYTFVPVSAAVAATVCPNISPLARGLAAGLGGLFGTMAGGYVERAKLVAARAAVAKLLAERMHEATVATEDLKRLVHSYRKRFGVGAGQGAKADEFEDEALCGLYQGLLTALLDGEAFDARDLPTLQRLKAALDLDGIVVGVAHRRAAQQLASKSYGGLEDEELRAAVDKLLFLSDRAFSDDEPEEARLFEMARVRKTLRVTEPDARARVAAVSRALYQQALTSVAGKVDEHTAEVLERASTAFGLESEEAARMNTITYRDIAKDLLVSGELTAQGKATLKRASAVLQLGDRAAASAFGAVAGPLLRKDVDAVFAEIVSTEPSALATRVAARGAALGLVSSEVGIVATEGLMAGLRAIYDRACKLARTGKGDSALPVIDELLRTAAAADSCLAALVSFGVEGQSAMPSPVPLTVGTDSLSGKRLYGIFLERSFTEAGEGKGSPEDLARLLELAQEDVESARIEVCQPRLQKLLQGAIPGASESFVPPTAASKAALQAQVERLALPFATVEETSTQVYKDIVQSVKGKVLKVGERNALEATREFLDLSEADVRVIHLKAFGKVFQESVQEAMGRAGIMSQQAKDGLAQLRVRLLLSERDATQIFHGVIQEKLDDFLFEVREAWEEATYSKDALHDVWKQRGKDVGDDPLADGTGGDLGITGEVALEGVRGYKLMTELCKVADFYRGNDVVQEDADPDEPYPVVFSKSIDTKTKEEMYGIYAWNAVTCQDPPTRDKWTRCQKTVGGVLGLSPADQKRVLVRMVSRWCNGFIKQKVEEQGSLKKDDIDVLQDWVPNFFGIEKDITKDMVQQSNKSRLQSKALRLMNKLRVTPEDVQDLRQDVAAWELDIKNHLELTQPQLRNLFRVEVCATLEDPDISIEQKQDVIAASRESFGLDDSEAVEEMRELLFQRCQGCLTNAVGDLLQGNEANAVDEMQRLALLAKFTESAPELHLPSDWEVALAMRQRLVKMFVDSAVGGKGKGAAPVDAEVLRRTLGVTA